MSSNSGIYDDDGIKYTVTLNYYNPLPYTLKYTKNGKEFEGEFKNTSDLTGFDDKLKEFIGSLRDSIGSKPRDRKPVDLFNPAASPAPAKAAPAKAAPAKAAPAK